MAKASVVLSFHDILLHQSDVDLLDGPYWLNDTIISFCFEYLEKIVFKHTKDLLFVSPEVTQCIKMVPSEEIKTFLEPLGMTKKKFVFFALNDNDFPDIAGGSHWSLLVYSKPENRFFHIDSSQMCNQDVAWGFAGHMMPYLEAENTMDYTHKECVQQTNGYDCGIHVICNAERLAEHSLEHGEISSCNLLPNIYPTAKRKEIAAIIRNLAASSIMDSPETDQTTSPRSNSLKISLPTVLCTSEPQEISDVLCKTNSFVSSESKLSLPSNLGTPTSPLRLSSPLSLPTSPLMKTSQQTNSSLKNNKHQDGDPKSLINSGSATGNPRNKCALQPGHSLMDWIRLGNSGKDLTGVGGRIRPVAPSELALHNKQDDAWLAIRGRVYNITHYLPYHPGGPEELMRGAGIDATQLFDKVHSWVNYDSLLAKCLVGPLRYDLPEAEELFDMSNPSPKSDRLREPSKAQELVRKSMENLANCITPVRKKITAKSDENVKGSPPSKIMQSLIQSSDLPVSISRRAATPPRKNNKSPEMPPTLRYDWIQTSTKLTISVYTGPLANPGGCARLTEGFLLIEVATNGWLRTLKITPEAKLREPLQLRVFAESGKIELMAHKEETGVWKGCGEVVVGTPSKVSSPRTVECRVMRVGRVSHDTTLLSVAPRAGPVVVPLGHHVRVHKQIEDSECVRSYTPVGDGWGPADSYDTLSALKLAVKKYDIGALSPHLSTLAIGDVLTLSGPYGNFELQKLKPVRTIYFIAAGTGITPMLGLIRFMLSRSNPRCERAHLLFFNKTEDDILFNENFNEMAKEDNRLHITHILSEANSSWTGHKGRITKQLLVDVLGKDEVKCSEKCTHFACICGPTEFTHTALDLLKKQGMKENDCVHAFMG